MDSAFVLTEEDTTSDAACNVKHASAVAAVEEALKTHNVAVITAPSTAGTFRAYTNFTTLQNGPICAASYTVAFHLFGSMPFRRSGKSIFGPLQTCIRSGMMSGPPADLQQRLNARLREFTEACIGETEAMVLEDKH
jgi:hypothetical protein